VALELAQVVAELVQAVGTVGEVKAGENGVVDLFSGPAAKMTSAVQQDFEKADDARVVDLDSGISDRADSDRKGEALRRASLRAREDSDAETSSAASIQPGTTTRLRAPLALAQDDPACPPSRPKPERPGSG